MRKRRAIVTFVVGAVCLILLAGAMPTVIKEGTQVNSDGAQGVEVGENAALKALETLLVKGRASKSGYERAQFGDGWSTVLGCSTRNIILNRDLRDVVLDEECKVLSGVLDDPYTGEELRFSSERSSAVQIDHVVALSDAWQKGAQQLTKERRIQLANDPLELLAVDGPANQQKGDGDAATWLPSNKSYRCAYVARQIAVKVKYSLWVTEAEKDAMVRVLSSCPDQALPTP